MATLLVIFLILQLVSASFDLNVHHIQFVADSLTHKECRKLIYLLEIRLFDENNSKNKSLRYNEDHTDSCLLELVNWNRRHGASKTFYDLKYSLDEIGAAEISNKLAQSINNEASLDLKHFFFEPFNVETKSKKDNDYDDDESGIKLTEQLKSISLKSSDRALRFLLKNRIEYLISFLLLLVSILVCSVIVRRYFARKRKRNHQI